MLARVREESDFQSLVTTMNPTVMGNVRVGNSLDGVVPCIHKQLDIPPGQAGNALSEQASAI
jgi:hypothetical protein